MNSPFFTIITACFNSANTIEKTIQSVLQQTYNRYELIVKDGLSSDNTIEIVRKYEEAFQGRLRIISCKDKCMYDAINQAIEVSNGNIISILNSDDYYEQNALELMSKEFINSSSDNVVVFGDMNRVDKNNKVISRYFYSDKMIKQKKAFGHPAMFASKEAYVHIGYYDTSYRFASDADWQYRMYESNTIFIKRIPNVITNMREGGASDNFKYRWIWFKERTRLDISHKKGPKILIYLKEFFGVIKCDIKHFFPKRIVNFIYRVKK